MQIKEKKYYNKFLKKTFSKFDKFDITKPLIIFGAGTVGRYLLKSLKINNIKVSHFVDNDPKILNNKIDGIEIISYKKLKNNFFDQQIIIASVIFEKEIYIQMHKDGFKFIYPLSYLNYIYPDIFNFRKYNQLFNSIFQKENRRYINKVYKLFSDKKSKQIFSKIINFRLNHYFFVNLQSIKSTKEQYFDTDLVKVNKKEIFIDGGGYIGDTIKPFVKFTKGQFKKIFSFEPDRRNFNKLKVIVRNLNNKRIHIYPYGLYSKNGFVEFYEQGDPESGIVKNNEFSPLSGIIIPHQENKKIKKTKLPVVRIDDFFKKKDIPSFIKMDIEGAELDALKGAKDTIKKFRPKLAICVYHNPSDLWEIPLLIKKLNIKYKLYLRHYSRELCETVCYAI